MTRRLWGRGRAWSTDPTHFEFGEIDQALRLRTESLVTASKQLAERFPAKALDPDVVFRLAAVDLFVEKAQRVLGKRAARMSIAGTMASAAAVLAVGALSYYIAVHAASPPPTIGRNELILRVVSAISLGGVVLVAVKYFVALARSFFHESVTLLSRRHALRFGRMYLYLNPTDVTLEHLKDAFDWNRGGESSFLDIRPGEIGQTPYTAIAQAIGDAMGAAFAKGFESATSTTAGAGGATPPGQ
ncbi:hypothetical protein [Nocardioides sp.]|uniref:hypothetical protein n=1 Tax=Nocardioides sp. TaxID=35761 RepID=UPI002611A1E3|nr:hypothetical protein [Nocardioides sp.]